MPEIVREGIDGFVVDDSTRPSRPVPNVRGLDRSAIRASALTRFSADRMVDDYERTFLRARRRPEVERPNNRDEGCDRGVGNALGCNLKLRIFALEVQGSGVGFLPYIFLVLVPTLVIAVWAAWRVRSTYSKWDKVDSGLTMSAFDFARYLLDRNGLQHVKIESTPGHLTDHYDPRSKTLRVSSAIAGSQGTGRFDPTEQTLGWSVHQPGDRLSVAAAAVIAHEVGHAAQDKDRDPFMAVRQLVVPRRPDRLGRRAVADHRWASSSS